jgi:cell wall-associated NlpC family hydrolase
MGSLIAHPRGPLSRRPHSILHLALMAIILALIEGCASTPKPEPVKAPAASPINLKVIRDAMTLEGVRYRYGEETPERGFDCSGFVQYVYGKHGVDLPRTAFDMASTLPALDETFREPGDLVFFNTTGRPYSHVGIYLGKNLFIHASSREGEVKVSEMDTPYWSRHYQGTRRPHRHGRHSPRSPSTGRWFY